MPVVTVNPGWDEWFNPWGPRRPVADWVASTPLTLSTPATAVQTRAPLQTALYGPPRARQDFIQGSSIVLQSASVQPPFRQMDWPVPRAAPRSVTLLTHTNSASLPLTVVFPVGATSASLPPRGPWTARGVQDWWDYIIPWALAPPPGTPTFQTDWPLPTRSAARNPQDFVAGSNFLPQPPVPPPVDPTVQPGWDEWFNPWGPKYPVVDWIFSTPIALTATAAVTVTPRAPVQTPLYAARRAPQDWVFSSPLTLQPVVAAAQPFPNRDWPNPRGPRYPVFDWIQSTPIALSAPIVVAVVPRAPLYTRLYAPPRNPQDFIQGTNFALTFVAPVKPPVCLDWPNPSRGPRRNPQDFIRAYYQPPQPPVIVNDPATIEWYNPWGPKYPVRDWVLSSPHVLITPPIIPPAGPGEVIKNEIRRVREAKNYTGRIRFLKNQVRN